MHTDTAANPFDRLKAIAADKGLTARAVPAKKGKKTVGFKVQVLTGDNCIVWDKQTLSQDLEEGAANALAQLDESIQSVNALRAREGRPLI